LTHGGLPAAYASSPAVAFAAAPDSSTIEIKGWVAEIFANKFTLQDASGRALLETGRQGERTALVAKDEAVTVQGCSEHGFAPRRVNRGLRRQDRCAPASLRTTRLARLITSGPVCLSRQHAQLCSDLASAAAGRSPLEFDVIANNPRSSR